MLAARFQLLVTAERVVDTLHISMDYNNTPNERLRQIKLGNLVKSGHNPTPLPRTSAAERGTWAGVGSSREARQLSHTRYIR